MTARTSRTTEQIDDKQPIPHKETGICNRFPRNEHVPDGYFCGEYRLGNQEERIEVVI